MEASAFLYRTFDMELQSAALFRLIFENALNGILLIDENLICLNVNPSLCQMLGRSRVSVLGHSCRTLVSAVDAPSLDIAVCQLWEKGSWQGELTMPASEGRNRIVEWKVSTEVNDRVALVILTDVTARRQYEEALAEAKNKAERDKTRAEEANQRKDSYLAMVSHELRTPLAAILGAVQVLKKHLCGDPATLKFLDIIERNTKVQLHTLEDLLDVSRIVAGIMKLDIRPVDLSSVVGTAVDTIIPVAQSKEVALEWQAPSKSVIVCADAVRFQQVVLNVLVNAIKFTPSKGSIRVGMAATAEHAQVMIRDTGIGMEPSLAANIFTPYAQGEGPERKEGIGLGLPIVKHLVELHGGRIEVHSEGKGKGTTVLVEVPLAKSLEKDNGQRV
jgi:PAS domain S-box-containing protein